MDIDRNESRDLSDMRFVSNGERVPFRCQLCGRCCKNAVDFVMLEPPDIFNLTRHLKALDDSIAGTEDVLEKYAHPIVIAEGFPVFVLNAEGAEQACIFLKDSRCTVYYARPRVCRLYPFGVVPGSKGRDFSYYLCTEKQHHFGSGIVKAGDWISANFSKEEREYLKADYDFLAVFGKAIRSIGEERFRHILFQFLYYRYYNFDLKQPFLPQYYENTETLMELLSKAADGGGDRCTRWKSG